MTERLRNAPKLTNAEKQKPVFPKIIFEISTINTDYLKSKFPYFPPIVCNLENVQSKQNTDVFFPLLSESVQK